MFPREATRTTAHRRVLVKKLKKEAGGLIDRIENFLSKDNKTQDKIAWGFIALVYAYLLGHIINYLLK